MDEQPAPLRCMAVLPQVDPLPCAKPQPAMHDRYSQRRCCQCRLDMGRHIVRAFQGMGVEGIILGHQAIEPAFNIVPG